jgi:hypothetical protein
VPGDPVAASVAAEVAAEVAVAVAAAVAASVAAVVADCEPSRETPSSLRSPQFGGAAAA